MIIPRIVYAALTPPQRLRAAIAALGRDDDMELLALKKSCPREKYVMTDVKYSGRLQKALALSAAVESDLQIAALNFLLAANLGIKGGLAAALTTAASLEGAWKLFLGELGIDHADMLAAGPPRHHAVETLLALSADEGELSAIEANLETMQEYWGPPDPQE